MIFVTVGTAASFDELLLEIDNGVRDGLITEEVICQIGVSEYIPQYCRYFKFKSSIAEEIALASIVVTHGGATVFELLKKKKIFIAVDNPRAATGTQVELLRGLQEKNLVYYCSDLSELISSIQRVKEFKGDISKFPCLFDDLTNYIKSI